MSVHKIDQVKTHETGLTLFPHKPKNITNQHKNKKQTIEIHNSKMKNMSKTLTTLTRLRQHYQEEQERKEAMEKQKRQEQQEKEEDSRDDLENRHSTPLPFPNTSVVEFYPEEVNDISPLKPEEADELELADILQGDDLSFLQELHEDDSDAIVPSIPQPNPMTTHRIPSDLLVVYDKVGHKRRRLSSMDDGW